MNGSKNRNCLFLYFTNFDARTAMYLRFDDYRVLKRKERQLTIQKRGSSSVRVVAARQTEEGQLAGERRSSSMLREYREVAAR